MPRARLVMATVRRVHAEISSSLRIPAVAASRVRYRSLRSRCPLATPSSSEGRWSSYFPQVRSVACFRRRRR